MAVASTLQTTAAAVTAATEVEETKSI